MDVEQIRHLDNRRLLIRCGMNCGQVVGGVIGTTRPRYSLVGDTVNMASRMMSTCVRKSTNCLLSIISLLRSGTGLVQTGSDTGSVGHGSSGTVDLNGSQGS